MALSKPPNVLIIGNPGVGKSTLLNGIVGVAKFKAGMSLDGGGVTKILQQFLHDGTNYVDTPGLDDDVSRRKCAAEIEKALKLGGLFFICFVITLEAGRIRPNDKSAIRLILDAAKQIGGQYSVIVNKLEPALYNAYTANPNLFKGILSRGFPNHIITDSVHFFPHQDALFGASNAVFQPETVHGFLDFLKNAPAVVIDPPKVEKVKDEEWEVKFQEYEKIIKGLYEEMEKNKIEFERNLAKERKRLDEQQVVVQRQQAEIQAEHRREMQRMRDQVEMAQRMQAQAQRDFMVQQQQNQQAMLTISQNSQKTSDGLAGLLAPPILAPIFRTMTGGCNIL